MRSSMAQVEPLPLVPPTVMIAALLAARSACLTELTRSRPRTMGWVCRLSTCFSHSSRVAGMDGGLEQSTDRKRRAAPGGTPGGSDSRYAREQGQQRGKLVAHLAAVDDHIQRTLLKKE